jgi:hypothetical protein
VRSSLPALAIPAIALALLHCGSSGEKSPADAGDADRAAAPLHSPALGSNSAFVVQAQWLVRDLLAALEAGIDRATLFELDDTTANDE